MKIGDSLKRNVTFDGDKILNQPEDLKGVFPLMFRLTYLCPKLWIRGRIEENGPGLHTVATHDRACYYMSPMIFFVVFLTKTSIHTGLSHIFLWFSHILTSHFVKLFPAGCILLTDRFPSLVHLLVFAGISFRTTMRSVIQVILSTSRLDQKQ